METNTTHHSSANSARRPLTYSERQQVRRQIDAAIRAKLGAPRSACPECGADLSSLTRPVIGCVTCRNRFWRRRQRAAA